MIKLLKFTKTKKSATISSFAKNGIPLEEKIANVHSAFFKEKLRFAIRFCSNSQEVYRTAEEGISEKSTLTILLYPWDLKE